MNLYEACIYGRPEIVRKWLQSGEKLEPYHLHAAYKNGNTKVVILLLRAGVNVNTPDKEKGLTPLHWACCNGHRELVQILLNAGADIETKCNDKTPYEMSNTEIKKIILEHLEYKKKINKRD